MMDLVSLEKNVLNILGFDGDVGDTLIQNRLHYL